jgi:RNA polymerase sigma-70 factor (ECF subfamily)
MPRMNGLETTWSGAGAGFVWPAARSRARSSASRAMQADAQPMEPEDLLEAIAARSDREAFARLFDAFAPRVKGYLMRLGLPSAAAEELAQETLLAVWRKASLFDRKKAGASAWIFTIARNQRISAARKERSASAYTVDVADEPDAPEQPDAAAGGAERQRAVQAALAALTPEQLAVLRLSFFQEKPHAEIAQELGIPLGTVKSRVRLALRRLRKMLEHLS